VGNQLDHLDVLARKFGSQNFGLFGATANGGGVAFFAHVGGFIFGAAVASVLTSAGRVSPQSVPTGLRAPA
jgi:membrane associated rhomboid family serine protease